ncbi:ABC transporter [Microbacterium flavum]|uniref:ABC transporter n=1 Tax=Microbacterium flavum TaxID=415216 RepID=A0ABS5XSX2_9MICO|nr:ABC transporter [Microbacterium flavum]MBT8797625.1 ABC transporter [Microbacterium flavum]
MSDHKYGEPVDEGTVGHPVTSADDAVASAHEGLADAEAASRDVVAPDPATDAAAYDRDAAHDRDAAVTSAEPVVEPGSSHSGYSSAASEVAAEPVAPAAPAAHGGMYADDPVDEAYVPGAYSDRTDAPTEVVAPAVVAPAAVAPAASVAPAPQPIFVQAPEAPRPRGNRGAAGLIGLLATVAFALLYLAAALGLRALGGDVTTSNVGTEASSALTSWWFWVPVAVFFLAFWLLGAIINRGRWGHWVIFGLFVGAASYGGHLLGQLFQAPFWQLTASQGQQVVQDQLLAPLAIVAFVVGRELTIWFGAWVAARGKRMAELNRESQREYERTLEAGPRIQQA